jgi:prephenate dehydrogenase
MQLKMHYVHVACYRSRYRGWLVAHSQAVKAFEKRVETCDRCQHDTKHGSVAILKHVVLLKYSNSNEIQGEFKAYHLRFSR